MNGMCGGHGHGIIFENRIVHGIRSGRGRFGPLHTGESAHEAHGTLLFTFFGLSKAESTWTDERVHGNI